MSLLEALLLDPLRMNIWIAVRTDGVPGTGTQNDPFDGSTQAKFDAIMNAVPILALGITRSGTTATVTAVNHGFANGNSVLIAGATGTDGTYYNGTFTIASVALNTFQYTMTGTPSGSAAGTISCRLSRSSGPMIPLPLNPPFAIRLGPGTFPTNGYTDGIAGGGGWQPRQAMKIVGSGAVGQIIAEINPTLRGWYGYFKYSLPSAMVRVGEWVRERIRDILRRRQKRQGMVKGRERTEYPISWFAERGLFNLRNAQAQWIQSSQGTH